MAASAGSGRRRARPRRNRNRRIVNDGYLDAAGMGFDLIIFDCDGRLVSQGLTNVLKNAVEAISVRMAP